MEELLGAFKIEVNCADEVRKISDDYGRLPATLVLLNFPDVLVPHIEVLQMLVFEEENLVPVGVFPDLQQVSNASHKGGDFYMENEPGGQARGLMFLHLPQLLLKLLFDGNPSF